MGPSVTANATSNYVTLGVGDEIFAVDVAIVREILAYRTIAHLPNAPPFLVGVIDVRWCTVPVIALRLKLGLPAVPRMYSDFHRTPTSGAASSPSISNSATSNTRSASRPTSVPHYRVGILVPITASTPPPMVRDQGRGSRCS
jgi:CheW-like domain